MSRPRKPYGPNPPGRLPATMIKVLAAEMSDQGRLSRGKRYWADDAVIDIVIGPGAVTAEVQGGRPDPYVVTLSVDGGVGVPSKREIWIECTCPDDSGFGSEACKHAVAALFAFSDEVAGDPSVLERWRATRRRNSNVSDLPVAASPDDTVDRERPADVIQFPRSRPDPEAERVRQPVRDPGLDEIARLLAAPMGGGLPVLPSVDQIEHPPIPDRILGDVLTDALAHLHLHWD